MSEPRSWLFVPADSEKKIGKAIESEADAVIFDLEDSVAPAQKAAARQILKDLGKRSGGPQWWVRINPLRTDEHRKDLDVLGLSDLHGIVLPKAESGADVTELAHRTGSIPIHAIVTETAASLFGLLSYRDPKSPLVAMSWGAEDLSAALGASSKYDADGQLSLTYKLARSLCLAGAVAAGVQPIDGVFADFRDEDGLRAEARPPPAKASPASSPSIPLRSARSMPPSPRRPRKSLTPALSWTHSRASRTPESFPSAAEWSTGPTSFRPDKVLRSHSIGDITCRRLPRAGAPKLPINR